MGRGWWRFAAPTGAAIRRIMTPGSPPVYDTPPSDNTGVRVEFPAASPAGARPELPRGVVSQERAALTIARRKFWPRTCDWERSVV